MNSEMFQSYVRRFLYWVSGALVSYGMVKPGAFWIEPAIGLLMTLATFAWSKYGDRLNGLLKRVEATDGVEKVKVEVDPEKIKPADVNLGTPSSVTATPA